jgi:hypothetical protein
MIETAVRNWLAPAARRLNRRSTLNVGKNPLSISEADPFDRRLISLTKQFNTFSRFRLPAVRGSEFKVTEKPRSPDPNIADRQTYRAFGFLGRVIISLISPRAAVVGGDEFDAAASRAVSSD